MQSRLSEAYERAQVGSAGLGFRVPYILDFLLVCLAYQGYCYSCNRFAASNMREGQGGREGIV